MPSRLIFWWQMATKSDIAEVVQRLDAMDGMLRALLNQERRTMATVKDVKDQADKVLAAVQAESDKDDAIIALVEGQTQMISDLKQQLADAIANGSDPAEIQAVLDSLTTAEQSSIANSDKVVAAVNANTPSE